MTDAIVTPIRPSPAKGEAPSANAVRQRRYRRKRKAVTVTRNVTARVTVTPPVTPPVAGNGVVVATTVAALSLAAVSAGFSITGMTAVFVGATVPVVAMGVALELGKLSAVAWLGRYG